MREVGKSTLLNKTGKMMAFGFGQHPLKPLWYMNIVVYRTDKEYVLCLSEIEKAKADPDALRRNLGMDVPGALFAPYAQRAIDVRLPLVQLKDALKNMDATLEWHVER